MTEDQNTNQQVLLEVSHITKKFPGVVALDDVSLQFMSGEVHAVVGETVQEIYPDEDYGRRLYCRLGDILLEGKKVSFAHPKEAHEMGVSIVYQEFNLLPERTVAQNIFLGREPSKFGFVDVRRMNNAARAVLEEIGVAEMIAPETLASNLSVAEQQLVEIAKAISVKAKVLIMDEPTAALTNTEVRLLNELICQLKSAGHGNRFYFASSCRSL